MTLEGRLNRIELDSRERTVEWLWKQHGNWLIKTLRNEREKRVEDRAIFYPGRDFQSGGLLRSADLTIPAGMQKAIDARRAEALAWARAEIEAEDAKER
jgi:hypothetical protein